MAVPSSTLQKGVGSSALSGTKGAAEAGRMMSENVAGTSGDFFRDNALWIGGGILLVLLLVNLNKR